MVICAYADRRWEALCDAVGAATAQRPDELIVVIDHNDALCARAAVAFDRATVVASAGPRGLSGARNTGVAAASGDILVFLDDDACPRPGWLATIMEAFLDNSVIGVGGTAYPRWEGDVPAWLPPEFYWVVGCSYRGLPQRVMPIRNPIGANMAFRRDVFDRVGGFSDGIGRVGRTPLGCEETELSIRATRGIAGRIVQIPGAIVDHLVPADRTGWRYFRRRCWAEGISKAIVAHSVGTDTALASERSYVTRTLPTGVMIALRDALRGERAGFARAGTIIAGLMITTAGYLRGVLAGTSA